MTTEEFLLLMRFPPEWRKWGMYPDDLAAEQREGYQPGHENAPEHDRNGAFHWWIRRNPDAQQISLLIKLAFLDPDRVMGDNVLEHLRGCRCFGPDHEGLIAARLG